MTDHTTDCMQQEWDQSLTGSLFENLYTPVLRNKSHTEGFPGISVVVPYILKERSAETQLGTRFMLLFGNSYK